MTMPDNRISVKKSVSVLLEGLPYIHQFHGKTIVVKYGGNAMQTSDLQEAFCNDVVLMKSVGLKPVIVHGGGPQINNALQSAGLTMKFIEGLRVTDRATMDVVEDVVINTINRELVAMIQQAGWDAFGLGAGLAGGLINAQPIISDAIDPDTGNPAQFGYVGQVESVNKDLLRLEADGNAIPVIAPIGIDCEGQSYNINADTVAAAVAAEIKAEKLVVLTNMPGILNRDGVLISTLTFDELQQLVHNKVISGGMLPKVRCAEHALKAGVQTVQIIDGRIPHSALLEIFTDKGVGTLITSKISV